MEWKIGEIRQINDEWYQCVNPKVYGCSYCGLQNKCIDDIEGKLVTCHARYRSDRKYVVFKKLEKVGEPYTTSNDKVVQNYLIEVEVSEYPKDIFILTNYGQRIIAIEIKQNKEDMEEKYKILANLVGQYMEADIVYKEFEESIEKWYKEYGKNTEKKLNIKSFNLEEAKLSKPVCTRDGRKARIICFDTKGDVCPIIALVEENGIESAYHYDKNGQNAYRKSELDLMMLPEKKEGWVNVYNADTTFYFVEGMVYDTKEEAIKHINPDNEIYTTTVKVQWEE